MPRLVVHNAISVDGRIAGFRIDVSCFYDLVDVWHEDATLAGSTTVMHFEDTNSEMDSSSRSSDSVADGGDSASVASDEGEQDDDDDIAGDQVIKGDSELFVSAPAAADDDRRSSATAATAEAPATASAAASEQSTHLSQIADEPTRPQHLEKKPEAEKKQRKKPILVVPDSQGRVRNWARLRASGFWREFIALCSEQTPQEYLDFLKRESVLCIQAGLEKVDLHRAVLLLEQQFGVQTIRVDSGGMLTSVLLEEGLVNEISLLIHPFVVGDRYRSFVPSVDLRVAADLKPIAFEQLDELLWVRYEVLPRRQPSMTSLSTGSLSGTLPAPGSY